MAYSPIAGKGGSATFNAVVLPITSWEGSIDRGLADTTCSANFDSTSNLVWHSQIPATAKVEVTVEGPWDTTTTNLDVATLAFAGGGPYATILGLTPTIVFGHGNFDISNFKVSTPVSEATKVSWSATLTSSGTFTVGS